MIFEVLQWLFTISVVLMVGHVTGLWIRHMRLWESAELGNIEESYKVLKAFRRRFIYTVILGAFTGWVYTQGTQHIQSDAYVVEEPKASDRVATDEVRSNEWKSGVTFEPKSNEQHEAEQNQRIEAAND